MDDKTKEFTIKGQTDMNVQIYLAIKCITECA